MIAEPDALCELPYKACDQCRRIVVPDTSGSNQPPRACISYPQASRNVSGGVHLQDDRKLTWHLAHDVKNELTIVEVRTEVMPVHVARITAHADVHQ